MNGYPAHAYGVGGTVVTIRQSPGCIAGGYVSNQGGLDAFVVFFDKPAAEVVLGTTPPYWVTEVYALSQGVITRAGEGLNFDRAISVAAVNTPLGTTPRTCDVHLIIQ